MIMAKSRALSLLFSNLFSPKDLCVAKKIANFSTDSFFHSSRKIVQSYSLFDAMLDLAYHCKIWWSDVGRSFEIENISRFTSPSILHLHYPIKITVLQLDSRFLHLVPLVSGLRYKISGPSSPLRGTTNLCDIVCISTYIILILNNNKPC